MSTNSSITFLNFSASLSCRNGVSIAFDTDEATDPVGLDFRVSCGERQKPVTYEDKHVYLYKCLDLFNFDTLFLSDITTNTDITLADWHLSLGVVVHLRWAFESFITMLTLYRFYRKNTYIALFFLDKNIQINLCMKLLKM